MFYSRNKQLIVKLKAGNLHAFSQLYEKYKIRVFNFIYQHLHCKEDAEEVLQDVFVRIWENRQKINEELSFDGYIFMITKNTMLNSMRIKYPSHQNLSEVHVTKLKDNRTEDQIHYHSFEELTTSLIEKMPPKRKRIFQLSRKDGLSNKEIASKLLISTKTVEAQLTKALKTIRKNLSSYSDHVASIFIISLFF